MANWTSILSFAATIVGIGAVLFIVYSVIGAISRGMSATQERLKERGVNVSKGGMSVKTSKRMDRERYVDATQRGLVNAYNASSVSKKGANGDITPGHSPSNSSLHVPGTDSPPEKKKRFSFKRSLSGSKVKD